MHTEHKPLTEFSVKIIAKSAIGIHNFESILFAKEEVDAKFIGLWMASEEFIDDVECKINCQVTGSPMQVPIVYSLPN